MKTSGLRAVPTMYAMQVKKMVCAAFLFVLSYPCEVLPAATALQRRFLTSLQCCPFVQNPPRGVEQGVNSILHQAYYQSCSPTSDITDIVDILGINVYNWCHRDDTFVTSGYQGIQAQFVQSGVNVPVMFSEYGCNQQDFSSDYPWTVNYRTWIQVPCIFNPQQMASSFSGGFAYTLVMGPNMRTAQVGPELALTVSVTFFTSIM